MNRQNNLYKFLRIIFLTLAIISLVFGLCKKVGLCAESSDSSITSYPLKYGEDRFSNISIATFEQMQYVVSNYYDFSIPQHTGYIVFLNETSTYNGDHFIKYYVYFYNSDCVALNTNNTDISLSQNLDFSNGLVSSTIKGFQFNYNMDTGELYNMNYPNLNSGITAYVNTFLESQNNLLSYKNTIFKYPFTAVGVDIVNANGDLLFGEAPEPFPSGHSKGGTIAQYTFDETDEPAPTDPSAVSGSGGWLSKILGGINKLNQSIGNGFTNIVNNLQSFFNPVFGGFEEQLNWFSEPFDESAFQASFNQIPIISDFNNLSTLVSNCGLFNWSDVTPVQRVAFTFDFGGSVLPHTNCEINFDWYTGSIKTLILSLITTFLVIGLAATLINQLPSIIGGKSGDKGGGSD